MSRQLTSTVTCDRCGATGSFTADVGVRGVPVEKMAPLWGYVSFRRNSAVSPGAPVEQPYELCPSCFQGAEHYVKGGTL